MDRQLNSELPATVHIAALCGSLRTPSYTYHTLRLVLERIAVRGATVDLIDLRGMALPFCNGDKSWTYPEWPDVVQMRRRIQRANGLVLASPEYHGGPSGVLKNALDLLDWEHMEGKVVGLISVLGGEQNANTLNQLRMIARHLHSWVIPEQIAIPRARSAFGADGEPVNDSIVERLSIFADSMVNGCLRLSMHSTSRALDEVTELA